MKLITAIIKTERLDLVREALLAADITRITVSRVAGHGSQASETIFRSEIVAPHLIPKAQIMVACNDEFVQVTCDAIISAARHGTEGAIGDGKIFVTPLEECIRIRTGEKGSTAI